MSNTIDVMFKEKNEKILEEKLKLDIDNNIDSLKLTIDNYLSLSSEKILKKISSLFNEMNLEYTISSLDELIKLNKNSICNKIYLLLDQKAKDIENLIKTKKINDLECLNFFQQKLDESSNNFKKEFEPMLHEEIFINMKNCILKSNKISSEDNFEKLSKIFIDYDQKISKNVMDAIYYRDNTLKNTTSGTYDKYLELNINTLSNQ